MEEEEDKREGAKESAEGRKKVGKFLYVLN